MRLGVAGGWWRWARRDTRGKRGYDGNVNRPSGVLTGGAALRLQQLDVEDLGGGLVIEAFARGVVGGAGDRMERGGEVDGTGQTGAVLVRDSHPPPNLPPGRGEGLNWGREG